MNKTNKLFKTDKEIAAVLLGGLVTVSKILKDWKGPELAPAKVNWASGILNTGSDARAVGLALAQAGKLAEELDRRVKTLPDLEALEVDALHRKLPVIYKADQFTRSLNLGSKTKWLLIVPIDWEIKLIKTI